MIFFFFNDTATTEIYTLSLHDALPIYGKLAWRAIHPMLPAPHEFPYTLRVVSEITESNGSSSMATVCGADRKSTRLNSSHANISYAVFCLKKKKLIHCFIHFTLVLTYR